MCGCGGSEEDATTRFEMHIIGFLFGCIVFDESSMSEESKVVRDQLKKHLDFEKYPRAWLMKEIDTIFPEGEEENAGN